jgi:hypothetical protein
MKFLVIRKVRTGTAMQATHQMIRAHKEVVLGAVKRGEADYGQFMATVAQALEKQNR